MSRFHSHSPYLFRIAAFLALLAMLAPICTSLGHNPAAVQSFIHICGLDQHAGGDSGKAPAHKLPSCPICQSLHFLGNGIVPSEVVVVLITDLSLPTYIFTEGDFLLTLSGPPQAQPRAPPILI